MITPLTEKIFARYGQEAAGVIQKSIEIAEEKHKNHRRADNSEYLSHVLAVAEILFDWDAPPEIIAAGILHDILKTKYANLPEDNSWEQFFSDKVVKTVNAVNGIDLYLESIQKNKELSAQNLAIAKNKLLNEMINQDAEVVIVKLADRLHNLRTAKNLPAERRKLFLQNIRHLAVSIASRLGMGKISRELQDRSFELLEPELYRKADIIYENASENSQFEELIDECQRILSDVIDGVEVNKFITNRYGIYRATLERNGNAPSVWDVSYINITVNDLKDCYTALGVIHSYKNFESAGYLKDFIAKSKLNGYRAIHTKLWKKNVGDFQIAIMTEEMAKIAEYGYSAKWMGVDEKNIPEYRQEISSNGNISVLTPYGKIISLKPKSTPIDFAFSIHKEVAYSYMYALVNGEWKPADTLLEDGDVVDIITSKTPLEPYEKRVDEEGLRTLTAIKGKSKKTRYKYYEFMIEGFDRIGLLQEVVRLFTNRFFNIISIQALQKPGNKFVIRCEIENRNHGKSEESDEQILEDLYIEINNVRSIISIEHKRIEKPLNKIQENPYSILPKATDNFKGRESEISEIVRYFREDYEHHGLFYISGQYKIGKTYLLRYLWDSVLPDKKTVNINISLEEFSIGPKENIVGDVLYKIASEIFHRLQNYPAFTAVENNTSLKTNLKEPVRSTFIQNPNPIEAFEAFLEKVRQSPISLRVVIMIDECQKIDSLNERQRNDFENLFQYFRFLVRDRFSRLIFTIMICGAGHLDIPGEKLSTKMLADVASHIHLDCLDYEAARSLIVSPISNAQINISYDDDAVDEILSLTACHPFYIQYLCGKLYEEAGFTNYLAGNENGNHLITREDVARLVEAQFRKPMLPVHLGHFWEMGEERDKERIKISKWILTAIADLKKRHRRASQKNIETLLQFLVPAGKLEKGLQELVEYGTVSLHRDAYHFKIPLLEKWLCKTQRLPN